MSEKLDNEVFEIERIDGKVINGDANKLKLLATSYAVVMEVQDAYIKEEMSALEDRAKDLTNEIESGNLSQAKADAYNKELEELREIIESKRSAYEKFSESRERFMEIAKKILTLPSENFDKLDNEGWIELEPGNKVNVNLPFEQAQKSLADEKGENVFSSIDSDAIKKEIENTINNKEVVFDDDSKQDVSDYIVENVLSDNFEEEVKDMATDVKNSLDENIVSFDNIDNIYSKATSVKDASDDKIAGDTKTVPVIDYEVTPTQDEYTTIFDTDKSSNSVFDDIETQDVFDFTGDKELEELNRQIEEARDLYEKSKKELTAKDEEKDKLAHEKDQIAKEAREKYEQASEIMEKRRAAARAKALEDRKAELESLRSQLLTTKEQIKASDETINSYNSEIAGFQASIDKSEKIINGDGSQMTSTGRSR